MKTLEVKKNKNKGIKSHGNLSLSRCISSGVETKFWTKIDGEDYLFKASRDKSPTDIGEVFYAYLCKLLNMPSLEIYFCTGRANAFSPKLNGVASKSYLTSDVISVFSCRDIIESNNLMIFKNKDTNVLSDNKDVEAIMQHINKFAETYDIIIDSDVEKNLKEMICLDILTGQIDRHYQNIEFLVYAREDGKQGLRLAPAFDNGRCFRLVNKNEKIYDNVPILVRTMLIDSLDLDRMFGIIEKIVSDKDVYNFYSKARQIDIEKTIKDFKAEYDYEIDNNIKKRIVRIWNNSFRNIRTRLRKYVLEDLHITETELDERFNIALLEMKNVLSDYNYFYDYQYYKKGGFKNKPNLKDYIKQQRQYQMKLFDWGSGILKDKPKIQNFPLLIPRDKNSEIYEKYQTYSKIQKEKRTKQIQDFISKNMPVDYFTIARIQNEYDYIKIFSGTRIRRSVKNSFVTYEQNEFMSNCENYIQYGEEIFEFPSLDGYNHLKNNIYSSAVIEQYLDEQIKKVGQENLNQQTIELAEQYNIILDVKEDT